MAENIKTTSELCKEYYESLDRSGLESVTADRLKLVFRMADIYREVKTNRKKDEFKSLEYKFEEAVLKIISSKNGDVHVVTNLEFFENFDLERRTANLELESDAEKILFILRVIDPSNILSLTWNKLSEEYIYNGSVLLSASNYAKAKNKMKSYYNGFFNIKLIIDEQSSINLISKLAEEQENQRKM